MAIRKFIELTCEGPCGKKVTVSKVPTSWRRIKVQQASCEPTQKPATDVALVCDACADIATQELLDLGFNFNSTKDR